MSGALPASRLKARRPPFVLTRFHVVSSPVVGWRAGCLLIYLMEDLPMIELIKENPGLFAGLGLYIATAVLILASRSPEVDTDESL
jgi:hypothetical protein